MTEKLYYSDPYMRSFDAKVVAVDVDPKRDGHRIVLDKTCFYPEGGGQPADCGTMGNVTVLDVRKEKDTVVHLCEEKPAFDVGDTVLCEINWDRRFDYMQQHTGQHVISGALFTQENINTLSVHMGEAFTTIEVDVPSVSEQILHAVEDAANRSIWENLEIRTQWVEDADGESLNLRRAPKVQGSIRIVQIEGADRVACGGVHVGRTSEIGLVKSVGVESIRGHARLAFKIGKRAIEDYREKTAVCGALTGILSAPLENLVGAVEQMTDRFNAQRRETNGYRQKYAEGTAQYLSQRPDDAITHSFDGEEKGFLKLVAGALLDCGRPFCLINLLDDSVQWCVGLPESAGNQRIPLNELLPHIGGKGGGKPPLWQGVGTDPSGASDFFRHFLEIIAAAS